MSKWDGHISDMAAAEIESLRNDGITLTDEQVVKIAWLCHRIASPDTRQALSRGRPVPIAGIQLWPLTLQAFSWLEGATPDTVRDELACTAYAMAHCYADGEPFDTAGKMAINRARRWLRGLRATPGELVEAIQQVQEQDAQPDMPQNNRKPPPGAGELSALLSATTSLTPEQIEATMSMSHAILIAHHIMAAQAAAAGEKVDRAYLDANAALLHYTQQIRGEAPNNG